MGKVNNARPPALPLPIRENVHALALPSVVDRWGRESAGVRALQRGDNVITMFGTIGEDFWGDGVTVKGISSQLRAIGGDVEVQINSPGGDVFEGFAIYNALREHKGKVTVKIMGMAASAASVIAMAGDEVQIGAAAFVMIHNCWVGAMGNRNDLRELANFLEPFDKALNAVYVARSGQKPDDVTKMMDAETYMSGAAAIEMGFADSLLPADSIAVDEGAKATDRALNDVRSMELNLISSGMTRAQARERIQRIKGKPGASLDQPGEDSSPRADDSTAILNSAGALLATLRKGLVP